jgi:hypothetical protein
MLTATALAGLSACATRGEQQAPEAQAESTPVSRAAADKQRQCLSEKRRMEIALRDSEKQVDDLQKKLDVLLAIDRELRSKKNR